MKIPGNLNENTPPKDFPIKSKGKMGEKCKKYENPLITKFLSIFIGFSALQAI